MPALIKQMSMHANKVVDYPRPAAKGDLHTFLGFISFKGSFHPNVLSFRTKQLLTGGKRNQNLKWTEEMVTVFEVSKHEMQVDLELSDLGQKPPTKSPRTKIIRTKIS